MNIKIINNFIIVKLFLDNTNLSKLRPISLKNIFLSLFILKKYCYY